MDEHFDDLDGLPVTSGGEYDPDAGASWGDDVVHDHATAGACRCEHTEAQSSGTDEALSGDVVERVRVGPYTADVQLERREGGLWIACAMISTETGVMSWCGAATEQEVAQRLARRRSGATAGSSDGGFDFGRFLGSLGSQIAQGAQVLARNRTLRRVVRDVSQTLNRPELQPVLAVAQQIPYLGQALGAVRAAATMADQILGGNPQARGRLQSVRRAAQEGNPIARQALEVLNDVLRAQQSSAQQRAGARAQQSSAQQRAGAPAPSPASGRRPRRPSGRRRPPRRGAPRRGRRRPSGGPTASRRRSGRGAGSSPRRPSGGPTASRRRSGRGAGSSPRRRRPRGRPLTRSSGDEFLDAQERAWRDASERWAEHTQPLVTPSPDR